MPEIFKENTNKLISQKPEEIQKTEELKEIEQKAALRKIEANLSSYSIDEAILNRDRFSLSDEQIKPILKKIIEQYLNDGFVSFIEELLEKFEVAKNIVKLQEFKEAAMRKIIRKSESVSGDILYVIKIKQIFSLDSAILMNVISIKKLVESSRIVQLKSGHINDVIRIEDNFFDNENNLSKEVMEAAEYGMIFLLQRGNLSDARQIKSRYKELPTDKLKNFFKEKIDEYGDSVDALLVINKADTNVIDTAKIRTMNQANTIMIMVTFFPECRPFYEEFINKYKKIANSAELSYLKKREAYDILGQFADVGDGDIINDFSEIIKNRGKQNDVPESKWGLDSSQETAFYALMRTNSGEGQEALLNLTASENVNLTIKVAILKNLTSGGKNFFSSDARDHIRKWLYSKPFNELDWRDLIFIRSIMHGIPNDEIRLKSENQIAYAMEDFVIRDVDKNKSIYRTWQEKYSNIPVNTFLQLYKFTDGESDLMEKFKELYASIKKDNNKKNDLLYGIVDILDSNVEILEKLKNILKHINFQDKNDAQKLINVLKGYVLADRLRQIKRNDDNDIYVDGMEKNYFYWIKEDPSVYELMDKLEEITNNFVTEEFRKKLNNKKITRQKVNNIIEKWNGDIEPIITYMSHFPNNDDDDNNLREYIAKMMVNFDDEKKWKKWRYDLNNEVIKNQIGHPRVIEKLEVWQKDYFVKMNDFMGAGNEGGTDKVERVGEIIENAVLRAGHIYNEGHLFWGNKNKILYKYLSDYYHEVQSNPAEKNEIISQEIKIFESYTEEINKFIKLNNSERIKKTLNGTLPMGKEIIPKKIKNNLDFLSAYLPGDLSQGLAESFKRLNKDEKINIDELFTPEMREWVGAEMGRLTEEGQKLVESSDIWDKFALNKENLNDLNQFHRARQEAKIILDLLKLNNLSADLITFNKIDREENKKNGRTITDVLENLKKFFKDSPFFYDLKNIEFLLKGGLEDVDFKNLAMFFTDDPRVLWQVGKYPFGCASCQHYDGDTSWSRKLMGYVGDAHCKVIFLINFDKLSNFKKERMAEIGLDKFLKEADKKELLEASVARVLTKITIDSRGEPVIIIEPTYSKANKDDKTMDGYFDSFVDYKIASPMGFKIGRAGGEEDVSIGPSRSPGGQYEDLGMNIREKGGTLNDIKFINMKK